MLEFEEISEAILGYTVLEQSTDDGTVTLELKDPISGHVSTFEIVKGTGEVTDLDVDYTEFVETTEELAAFIREALV